MNLKWQWCFLNKPVIVSTYHAERPLEINFLNEKIEGSFARRLNKSISNKDRMFPIFVPRK